MKNIVSIIALNIIFFVLANMLMILFLGVYGEMLSLGLCIAFAIIFGFLVPKLTEKKNDIDADVEQ